MKALITGGHVGLGLEVAKVLCSHGYDVVVAGRSVTADNAIRFRNEDLIVTQYRCDFGNTYDLSKLITRHGPFNVVINNANVIFKGNVAEPEVLNPDDLKEMIRSNIYTPYNVIKATWRQMVTHQIYGTFINVSSMGAIDPLPCLAAYGATKAWLECYSKAMVESGKEPGIRTIVVRLGAVKTPTLKSLFPHFDMTKAADPVMVAERIWQALLHGKSGDTIAIEVKNQKEGFK